MVRQRSGWQVRPFDLRRVEALYDARLVPELAAVEIDIYGDTTHMPASGIAVPDAAAISAVPMSALELVDFVH
jgi:hypothetical protein